MYLKKNENKKPKPYTYDMTFCVSKCKKKCERHYSKYSFDTERFYSMADFNCKNEEWARNEVEKNEQKRTKRRIKDRF